MYVVDSNGLMPMSWAESVTLPLMDLGDGFMPISQDAQKHGRLEILYQIILI